MGQYKNGKWEPTFGDVQAGVSDYAPGERSPQEALSIKDKKIAELEQYQVEVKRLRDALQRILGKPDHTNEPLIGNQLIAKRALEGRDDM